MKRRDFFQLTGGALLAGGSLAGAQVPPSSSTPGAAGPLKIDIYSRHLQWLRQFAQTSR